MKMNPKLNSFILNIFNKNLLVASYLCISLCLSVCSFILCSSILCNQGEPKVAKCN